MAEIRVSEKHMVGISVKLLTERNRKLVLKYARALRIGLATATPYRTGRARAGWNLSAKVPDLSEKGPDYNTSRAASARAGNVRLEGYRVGDDLHITNRVFYITLLNGGSSKQAPALFVETTIQRVTRSVLGARITLE